MKRTTYTETQIVNILKEAEAGIAVEELGRKHGFSMSGSVVKVTKTPE